MPFSLDVLYVVGIPLIALLARRQLLIVWTLAALIFASSLLSLFLDYFGFMEQMDPMYFFINLIFATIACLILLRFRNSKTVKPFLAVWTQGLIAYLVFAEYFMWFDIFYNVFSELMLLLTIIQVVLIINIGDAGGTIRAYLGKQSRPGASYRWVYFCDFFIRIGLLFRPKEIGKGYSRGRG